MQTAWGPIGGTTVSTNSRPIPTKTPVPMTRPEYLPRLVSEQVPSTDARALNAESPTTYAEFTPRRRRTHSRLWRRHAQFHDGAERLLDSTSDQHAAEHPTKHTADSADAPPGPHRDFAGHRNRSPRPNFHVHRDSF